MDDARVAPLVEGAIHDASLRAAPAVLRALQSKRIDAWRGDPRRRRDDLFAAISEGKPIVLTGVRVPVEGESRLGLEQALLKALARGIGRGERFSAQTGPGGVRRRLPAAELVRRWRSPRSIVSITDLHVRGTRLETDIDTRELSRFNILPLGSEGMRRQEMMTIVMSSRGNVTDSHSDDPDGSNHCFVGRKLWLAWETFEGRAAGLQDCSRDEVNQRASFDMRAFASLPSACWWTVGPGETLFLPGRYSHRVITLDAYIGIGSFYCTPASCLENLSRWYRHGPLWSMDDEEGENEGLVDEIAGALTARIARARTASDRVRQAWGLDQLQASVAHWRRRWKAHERRRLASRHPSFAQLLRVLGEAGATA